MSEILLRKPVIYIDDDVCSLPHLREKIHNREKIIEEYKTELKMLVMANPKELAEDQDPIDYVNERVDDIVGMIREHETAATNLQNAEDVIINWQYTNGEDVDVINTDSKEGFNKVVFNQDPDHIGSNKYDKNNPFIPKDMNNFSEYLNLCDESMNERVKVVTKDMYAILVDKQAYYKDRYGDFIFPSYEAARKKVEELLDISCEFDIFSKKYMEAHPGFIDSFIEEYKKMYEDTPERWQEVVDDINDIRNSDKFDYKMISVVGQAFRDLVVYKFSNKLSIVKL